MDRIREPLLVAAAVLLPASPAFAAFTRAPFVQNQAATTASIYWEAGSAGGTQSLQWGPGTTLNQTVAATQVSPLGSVYKVDLPQLTPSTSYSWQVTSGTDVSDVGSFVTAPTDGSRVPFRFVVYGDNRTNDSDHAKVVAGIQAHSPDFVLNTGDLEDTLTTFNYVTFFSIEKALLEHVGIFPCPGNHDIAAVYQGGFGRPNNYTWRWANAAFVVVSATDPVFGDSYAVGSTQYNWIQTQLQTLRADPTVDWLFVYHHEPVYSSDGTHGSTADMATTINPLYKTHGVDVVFNGHAHDYERIEKDNIVYFVAGGGGAPLYGMATTGQVAGSQKFDSTLSYLVADIDGLTATFTAFDTSTTSGNQIDSKQIVKTAGTPSPTPTGTPGGGPTPTPGGGGGNGGSGGGCDVGATSAAPPLLLFGLMLTGGLLRRRPRT